MTHCDCSALLAAETALCSSSRLAFGALWINTWRLMSHVLRLFSADSSDFANLALRSLCFRRWDEFLFFIFLFLQATAERYISSLLAVGELSRGEPLAPNLLFCFFFSLLLFSVREQPIVPRGAFSEPAIIHTNWQLRARTSTVPAYVTEAINSHGPHLADKAPKQSIKTNRAKWQICRDTKKWRHIARVSPLPPLSFFFFPPPPHPHEEHIYILYTCTPTSACPGKIIRAPATPHTLHADGGKIGPRAKTPEGLFMTVTFCGAACTPPPRSGGGLLRDGWENKRDNHRKY